MKFDDVLGERIQVVRGLVQRVDARIRRKIVGAGTSHNARLAADALGRVVKHSDGVWGRRRVLFGDGRAADCNRRSSHHSDL